MLCSREANWEAGAVIRDCRYCIELLKEHNRMRVWSDSIFYTSFQWLGAANWYEWRVFGSWTLLFSSLYTFSLQEKNKTRRGYFLLNVITWLMITHWWHTVKNTWGISCSLHVTASQRKTQPAEHFNYIILCIFKW